jgi:hypothetical protein
MQYTCLEESMVGDSTRCCCLPAHHAGTPLLQRMVGVCACGMAAYHMILTAILPCTHPEPRAFIHVDKYMCILIDTMFAKSMCLIVQ